MFHLCPGVPATEKIGKNKQRSTNLKNITKNMKNTRFAGSFLFVVIFVFVLFPIVFLWLAHPDTMFHFVVSKAGQGRRIDLRGVHKMRISIREKLSVFAAFLKSCLLVFLGLLLVVLCFSWLKDWAR